jgi:hypothetical protein
MKYLVLAFLLVICATPAFAEDYTMTTYYPAPEGRYDLLSANNIGIGTTDPLTKLEVYNGNIMSYNSASAINAQMSANPAFGAVFGAVSNHDTVLIANNTEIMRVKTSGNVGIGVTAPSTALHVQRNGTDAAVFAERTGFSPASVMLSAQANSGIMGTVSNNPLFLATNNVLRMAIDTSGNVGIGVMAPAAKLHIIAPGGFGNEPLRLQSSGTFLSALDAVAAPRFAINNDPGLMLNFYGNDGAWFNWMSVDNTGTKAVSFNTGNVGIAVAAPSEKLEVVGNTKVNGNIIAAGNGINNSRNLQIIETNTSDWLRINWNSSYTQGVAIAQPVALGTGGLYVGSWANAGNGNIRATNDITAGNDIYATNTSYAQQFWHWSDERLKENITPVTNALEKVQALQGVYYNFKGKEKKQLGLIAQDVEKVIPEVVGTAPNGMKALDYSNLVAVLIEAIKEQQTKIDALEKELKAQRADLETLKRSHQ